MFRISLRQLLIVVAIVALAIVSLKYASPFWQGLIGLAAMLAVSAAIIAAIFERGPRQSFAIGFVIVILGYALLFIAGLRLQLPTSLLLSHLYLAISRSEWRNTTTGQIESEESAIRLQATPKIGVGGLSFPAVESRSYPLPEYYYPTGHYWWTLILGYVGGFLAQLIYVRRM
jgi:hypothetical protein